MKKLFFTLCALCLCGTMWGVTTDNRYWYDSSRPTEDSEIYVDQTTNLYFYLSGENAVITYINENDGTVNPTTIDWTSGYNYGNLTIPEQVSADGINFYNVTMIGGYAFYLGGVTGDLTIPEFITQLGRSAFEGCTGITSVTLEYSATALQEENGVATANSFYGCSGIKTVYLNRDVNDGRSSSASNYAYLDAPFSYLTSIETIYVGEQVTKIPYNMFNCNGSTTCALTTVYCYATDHIPSLDFRSFGQHTDLTLYVYDELVENFEADHQTYTDNYSNTSGGWGDIFTVTGMGSMPTTLEDGTYKDVATGLYFEIDEETGVVSIYHDEAGVYTNANLVVYSVDKEGNANAYTLPSTVDDGDGHSGNVTRIEESAFAGSSISGHIVIPAFIANMGASAFDGCTNITEVTYEYNSTALNEENNGNGSGGSFANCKGIITLNMYRDVTWTSASRQNSPFLYLGTIATLNIGPHVTTIYTHFLRNGSNVTALKTINCYSANPPSLADDALGVVSGMTINVPQGSVAEYEEKWTEYNSASSYASTIQEMSNAYAVNIHNVDTDGEGYATFYDSKAVKLYGDVVAYTVSGVEVEGDNAYVLMQELGDVIPAGTGALLSGDVAYYTAIEETAVSGETYSGTDYLLGFDEDGQTTVAPNGGSADDYYFYMLTLDADNEDGTLAFYWGTTDGGTFTCSAHKAYLALKKSVVSTHRISLKKGDNDGGDTTGISAVEVENEANTVKGIYTLQGVRVSDMSQKGVYIVDGKKVLVK